jgi:iron complex outermembrane receptor protein
MMKKYFTTLIVGFVICIPSFSQIIVVGKITDQSKAPVAGASVLLRDQSKQEGTVSNDDGTFKIQLGASGVYDIEIKFLGFDPFVKSYTFSENQEYDLGRIVLTEYTQELQTVEVTGRLDRDYTSAYSFSATKMAIKNKELPQSLTTVTKELMSDRQAFQLADAVETVSGVSPSSFYNQYNIRGISQNEEGQIVNGMRTRQYYFLQPITSNIERVGKF